MWKLIPWLDYCEVCWITCSFNKWHFYTLLFSVFPIKLVCVTPSKDLETVQAAHLPAILNRFVKRLKEMFQKRRGKHCVTTPAWLIGLVITSNKTGRGLTGKHVFLHFLVTPAALAGRCQIRPFVSRPTCHPFKNLSSSHVVDHEGQCV